ncbi:hypothetical protein P4679_23085 [Priestia megaterium]|uniref:hypothetical protein n=1 Tax=Priestia megaterium TaxID=1404 RepID=UPI002E22C8B7|nr:hypothetical protein [Priestia megaterium]
MKKVLSEKETHSLMTSLTEEQRHFISNYVVQCKKSKWLEVLSRSKRDFNYKNTNTTTVNIETNEWTLKTIIDGGYGKRPSKCDCGASLRHQYIVYNSKEDKEYKFGSTCFEEHTNLNTQVVKDIKRGFYLIDIELDEILIKYKKKELFDVSPFLHLKDDPVAAGLIKQAKLNIPLSTKQIDGLRKAELHYKHNRNKREAYKSLNELQITLIEKLPLKEQIELVKDLIRKEFHYEDLPDTVDSAEIQLFVKLGLPLLNRHRIRFNTIKFFSQTEQLVIGAATENQPPSFKEATEITYDAFMKRHLHILKKVRENQDKISSDNEKVWINIQHNIKEFRNGKEFNHSAFKVDIGHILKQLDLSLENKYG